MSSVPTFRDFSPEPIAWQDRLIDDFECNIDWSTGMHEFFLSGSVGSAKTSIAVHMAVKHCLGYKNATLMIGRRALPDLKDTLFQGIIDHLEGSFIEGRDYWVNRSSARIKFRNGSKIISRSWADKNYKKLGSLLLSAAIVEEGAENDGDDTQVFDYLRTRVQRQPHVPKSWLMVCTNPDEPDHYLHKYYIENKHLPNRHVYYSVTTDNPFLPSTYVDNLMETLDPIMVRRMVYGEWVSIAREKIYSQYNRDIHYKNIAYKINPQAPIYISFDFNIGHNKPYSVTFAQFVGGIYHIYNEVIVEGFYTEDVMVEMQGRGLLDHNNLYIIHGDATGSARTPQSKVQNYEQIEMFLARTITANGRRLRYHLDIPRANPPIKKRHALVNGMLKNAKGQVRLQVYKDAPTVDEGFRLTSLKKKAGYIEDDSKPYQHCTTSLGYSICKIVEAEQNTGPSAVNL